MRPIYTAPTSEAAEAVIDIFEQAWEPVIQCRWIVMDQLTDPAQGSPGLLVQSLLCVRPGRGKAVR